MHVHYVPVNAPEQPGYRNAPWTLNAEWIVEEADLHAATKALPGSTLALVRWPFAFFIAYVGVGLSDGRTGVAFTLGSAAVITVGWLVLSLGSRGTTIRKQAQLPQQQRSSRISIDSERIRQEAASGHAGEFPTSEITHAKFCTTGVLLNVRGQVFFIPLRAIRGNEEAWRAFVGRLPSRGWPRRIGFTVGLWVFAVLVALYGFIK